MKTDLLPHHGQILEEQYREEAVDCLLLLTVSRLCSLVSSEVSICCIIHVLFLLYVGVVLTDDIRLLLLSRPAGAVRTITSSSHDDTGSKSIC